MIFNKYIEKLSNSFGGISTPKQQQQKQNQHINDYNNTRNIEYEKAMAATYINGGHCHHYEKQYVASKKKKPNKSQQQQQNHRYFLSNDELATINNSKSNSSSCNSSKSGSSNNSHKNNNDTKSHSHSGNYLNVPESSFMRLNTKDIPALRITTTDLQIDLQTREVDAGDLAPSSVHYYEGDIYRTPLSSLNPSPASSYTTSLSTESLTGACSPCSSMSSASTPTSLSTSPPRFHSRPPSLRLSKELAAIYCRMLHFPWVFFSYFHYKLFHIYFIGCHS